MGRMIYNYDYSNANSLIEIAKQQKIANKLELAKAMKEHGMLNKESYAKKLKEIEELIDKE